MRGAARGTLLLDMLSRRIRYLAVRFVSHYWIRPCVCAASTAMMRNSVQEHLETDLYNKLTNYYVLFILVPTICLNSVLTCSMTTTHCSTCPLRPSLLPARLTHTKTHTPPTTDGHCHTCPEGYRCGMLLPSLLPSLSLSACCSPRGLHQPLASP